MVFSRVPGFVNHGRCTLAAKGNSARLDPAHPMCKKDGQEKRNRQADTRRQRTDHPLHVPPTTHSEPWSCRLVNGRGPKSPSPQCTPKIRIAAQGRQQFDKRRDSKSTMVVKS
jgi:hypothetical protein